MAHRCLALATLLALAGLGAQGVQLQTSAASQVEADFTPEQRKLLHEQAFEKEFTVELDMITAREKDLYIGVELDTDTDFTPISVSKIRKTGVLEMWNKNNPSNAVLVGDQITKVNDIQWHANSKTFSNRIKAQYKAYKGGKEGSKDVLSLFIQRPRKTGNEGRTQEQRDDVYRQQYPKDFHVDVPFVPNQAMGWVLNATVDWKPPTIASLSSTGMVALWNQHHPDFRVYPGDEVVMSNGIHWHHNTRTFRIRIETMLRRTMAEANSTVAMSLHIQRPRSVVEVLESKSCEKVFDVTLPHTNGSAEIGLTLQMNSSDPINITDIHSVGFISSWNEKNPTQRLAVGDRILTADSVNWHRLNRVQQRNSLLNLLRTRGTTVRVQRKAEFKYAKGWTVEIPAREGKLLGLRMDASDDEFPVAINTIKPLSAVSIFNEDNPDDAVMPGDHIFMVNDVLWHKNSRNFAQRLEKQFAKSRRTGAMRLWVQRPEGLELEDDSPAHYKEYSVELNVSSPHAMGWQLNTTGDGQVFISELTAGTTSNGTKTSVSSWNEKNLLKDIQVGDQIRQVDANRWHNNTENFMKQLNHQLVEATSSNGKGSVLVLLRRPYKSSPEVQGDVTMFVTPPGAPQADDDGDDVMGAEEE